MEQKTEASQAVDKAESRLDAMMCAAFDTNHPAMHDYVLLKMELKRSRAALKAQPAPNKEQGGKLLELFKHTLGSLAVYSCAEAERIGKLYRETLGNTSNNSSSSAQGEDSARLECAHDNGRSAHWDWIECDDCHAIYTGIGEDEWGIAQRMWFKSVSEAKFYKSHGRYPDSAASQPQEQS